MKSYDFGISWVYSKDKEFVRILKEKLKKRKLTFFEIGYNNVDEIIDKIKNDEISFNNLIDFASFEHPVFSHFASILESKNCNVINSKESIKNSYSKSKLFTLFEKENLPMRKTFIVNNGKKQNYKEIISKVKVPFVITPSSSSYEHDIILNGKDPEDIGAFIENHETEEVLVQEFLTPKIIHGKIAWFRILYACGEMIIHWWDPQNSFYRTFGKTPEENKIKHKLESYTEKISQLTELKLFSTEIILSQEGKYVIIDYANNPIDLSSQEYERDGIPKETLNQVAEAISKLK